MSRTTHGSANPPPSRARARHSRSSTEVQTSPTDEQFIETINIHQLRSGTLWPIMRLLAPRFVEEIELGRYMRRLLGTHRWSVVRVVPLLTADHLPSKHIFDVYGLPVDAGIRSAV